MYAQAPCIRSYQPPNRFPVHPQPGLWNVDPANSVHSGLTEDQRFVKQFERNILATKTRPAVHVNAVKIPEIRSLLRRSNELIGLLKEQQSYDIPSSQVSNIQLELDAIQHMVESSLDETERKVKRRARKRLNRRNNRQHMKLEHDRRCKEGHEKLDQWLADKEAEKLKLKLEKEVKLSAAEALHEVETKESDILRYIKFVELLEKLKAHRSEIHHRSAELITIEADLKFKNTIKSLQEFLLLRKEEYEKEKKALHVIMEEEVQDRIAAAAAATASTQKESSTQGQHANVTPQVAALLHIRQQWDAFLSPVGTPLPMEPLLPCLPSSVDWETCLVSR